MSAFTVGKPHIDAIVTAGLKGPAGRPIGPGAPWYNLRYFHDGQSKALDHTNADQIGAMLWQENHNSVAYRYPDGDLPGPVGFDSFDVAFYSWKQIPERPTAVEALKAIRCYMYQSCEHPGWEASEAKAFCDALTAHLINALPGYDEAPWEWTR